MIGSNAHPPVGCGHSVGSASIFGLVELVHLYIQSLFLAADSENGIANSASKRFVSYCSNAECVIFN